MGLEDSLGGQKKKKKRRLTVDVCTVSLSRDQELLMDFDLDI